MRGAGARPRAQSAAIPGAIAEPPPAPPRVQAARHPVDRLLLPREHHPVEPDARRRVQCVLGRAQAADLQLLPPAGARAARGVLRVTARAEARRRPCGRRREGAGQGARGRAQQVVRDAVPAALALRLLLRRVGQRPLGHDRPRRVLRALRQHLRAVHAPRQAGVAGGQVPRGVRKVAGAEGEGGAAVGRLGDLHPLGHGAQRRLRLLESYQDLSNCSTATPSCSAAAALLRHVGAHRVCVRVDLRVGARRPLRLHADRRVLEGVAREQALRRLEHPALQRLARVRLRRSRRGLCQVCEFAAAARPVARAAVEQLPARASSRR